MIDGFNILIGKPQTLSLLPDLHLEEGRQIVARIINASLGEALLDIAGHVVTAKIEGNPPPLIPGSLLSFRICSDAQGRILMKVQNSLAEQTPTEMKPIPANMTGSNPSGWDKEGVAITGQPVKSQSLPTVDPTVTKQIIDALVENDLPPQSENIAKITRLLQSFAAKYQLPLDPKAVAYAMAQKWPVSGGYLLTAWLLQDGNLRNLLWNDLQETGAQEPEIDRFISALSLNMDQEAEPIAAELKTISENRLPDNTPNTPENLKKPIEPIASKPLRETVFREDEPAVSVAENPLQQTAQRTAVLLRSPQIATLKTENQEPLTTHAEMGAPNQLLQDFGVEDSPNQSPTNAFAQMRLDRVLPQAGPGSLVPNELKNQFSPAPSLNRPEESQLQIPVAKQAFHLLNPENQMNDLLPEKQPGNDSQPEAVLSVHSDLPGEARQPIAAVLSQNQAELMAESELDTGTKQFNTSESGDKITVTRSVANPENRADPAPLCRTENTVTGKNEFRSTESGNPRDPHVKSLTSNRPGNLLSADHPSEMPVERVQTLKSRSLPDSGINNTNLREFDRAPKVTAENKTVDPELTNSSKMTHHKEAAPLKILSLLEQNMALQKATRPHGNTEYYHLTPLLIKDSQNILHETLLEWQAQPEKGENGKTAQYLTMLIPTENMGEIRMMITMEPGVRIHFRVPSEEVRQYLVQHTRGLQEQIGSPAAVTVSLSEESLPEPEWAGVDIKI